MKRHEITVKIVGDQAVATLKDNRTGRIKEFKEDLDVGMEGLGGYNIADMRECKAQVQARAEAYSEGLLQGEVIG